MIWRCPACHGPLENDADEVHCDGCLAVFPVVSGIPDLRYPPAADDDAQRDMANARRVAATSASTSVEQLVRDFFSSREGNNGWTSRDTETRVRQSLGMPARMVSEVRGWLRSVTDTENFLDIGCGLGGLLSAAASIGKRGVGIDNRMHVLVLAKRLIETNGGEAELACALAEALPLADNAVGGVVMCDVVEHITNLPKALSEASRVTAEGGAFACSTPNRFSIAPEPHVHLMGVGWLPRRYQASYVKNRSGWDYRGTRLLTPSELLGLMKESTAFRSEVILPSIPDVEIAASKGPRRALARSYNAAARQRLFRNLLLRVGPFFQVTGIKASIA